MGRHAGISSEEERKMRTDENGARRAFRPGEIEQMCQELRQGDRKGESPVEREKRAIAIIERHSAGPKKAATSVPLVRRGW